MGRGRGDRIMTSRLRREQSGFSVAILALALGGAGLAGCQRPAPTDRNYQPPMAVINPCRTVAPTRTSALPTDPGSSQTDVDCSAWQAFIALNWRADPNDPGHPDS